MLGWLRRLSWRVRGRIAGRRQRAPLLPLAAESPIRERLTELSVEAAGRGLGALTARQQLVVRTWEARGVISNGGFRLFLRRALPLPPVADGFRTLGFPEAASACERVMRAVAAAPALGDEAKRAFVLWTLDRDAFDAEAAAVFAVEVDALEAAVGAFMRGHPRDFPGFPARAS